MKRLIAGLYILFGFLLAGTITLAVRSYDGTVEDRYSLRGERFLADREREEALGLTIRVPDRMAQGENRFEALLSTAGGPLRNAAVSVRAMRISGMEEDRTVPLWEEGPGRYAGILRIPFPGTWMMRLSVRTEGIDTVRAWTVTAGARPGNPGEGDGGIHAGPVTGSAGSQPVILEIAPRPVRAMTDLRFTVRLPGLEEPAAPWIALSMPGMRMPPNRVDLERGPDGAYRGTGVIVRCRSGRRTWQAAVTVPGKGTARFTFDVAS